MIISKKNRHEICKYLFQEGVLYAKKDYNLEKHPLIDVPNLQVIKLMQSFKSKEFVRETFAWEHYYWYLTNDGIEHIRTYLNLPSEIVPATLKKAAKPPGRPFGSGPLGDRPRGPRFEGDRPRFGDRDGYRGGPCGEQGDFVGDKSGVPPEFQPSFRGCRMIRSANPPRVIRKGRGLKPEKLKVEDDKSSCSHGDDVAPQDRKKEEEGILESFSLLVQHFVEPWEGRFVRNRKKTLIDERMFPSDVIEVTFPTQSGEVGAGGRIGQCIQFSVKASDKMDDLFKIITYATRIWCLDEVELYFVRNEDDGPFNPCNELESLFCILKSIESLRSTSNGFVEVLNMLDEKIRMEIESYVRCYSADYVDEQPCKDYDSSYDELLEWAIPAGRKMSLRVAKGEKRFVASEAIDIGDTILSIPPSKLIDFNVYNDDDMQTVLRGAFHQKVILSLWCMKEKYNKNSPFASYFKVLPERFKTGLDFDEDALAALEGTDLDNELKYMKMRLEDQFDELKPVFDGLRSIHPEAKFSWDEYLWAHGLIYSSSLEVCMFGGVRELCLIPHVSFFSRSLCPHILRCDTTDKDGNLNFVAVRPCLQGYPCYLSCGNLSGDDLIAYYGFLPKGKNHNDVIHIELDDEDPPEHSEWPYLMVRRPLSSKQDLPELLVSYLCTFSEVDKNKLSGGGQLLKAVSPLLDFLQRISNRLGNDDTRFMRMGKQENWDFKLALDYRRLMRETVRSAFGHLATACAVSGSYIEENVDEAAEYSMPDNYPSGVEWPEWPERLLT